MLLALWLATALLPKVAHAQLPPGHTVAVTPTATPPELISLGTTQLDSGWSDSVGHEPDLTVVSWSDGGAGGAFLPSPYEKNPTYVAPSVAAGSTSVIVLQCQMRCSADPTLVASGSTFLTLHGDADEFLIQVLASPVVMPSGGLCQLTVSDTDSWNHGFATWWDDGGQGGTFAPSSTGQATYTVRNTRGRDVTVNLTATADCGGWAPVYAYESVRITVQPDSHSFWVTLAPPNPGAVASGGTAQLDGTFTDWQHHGLASWVWSDGGAGGVFSPSPEVPNPTYTAPVNDTAWSQTIALSVTAKCDGAEQLTDTNSALLTVSPAAAGSYRIGAARLPTGLMWDEIFQADVNCQNLDASPWEPGQGYQLVMLGDEDHWGIMSVDLGWIVAPQDSYDFSFGFRAPPVTTLGYDISATPAVPISTSLDCSWGMAHGGRPLTGAPLPNTVTVSRFWDIQPGTGAAWARPYIEECAGRVPPIVEGYGDGTYRPALPVDRASMAVYVARAMELQPGPYEGTFRDVPEGYWAAPEIESLARAGVVQGFGNYTYQPDLTVNRASMAAYIARGIAGGDAFVPTSPTGIPFRDVPRRSWAYDYIAYLAARGTVEGFGDGTYRPGLPVTRDQMAVYVYRAFVQPSGVAVVLGGPAITAEPLEAIDYHGWPSAASGSSGDPGYGYVLFDAMRLGPDVLYPRDASGTWQVKFELRSIADTETPAPGRHSSDVFFGASDIAAAQSAALASGIPYCLVFWDIPEGMDPGDYVLVVSTTDSEGSFKELERRVPFSITP